MRPRLKGNLLVVIQFVLLGLLIFFPQGKSPYGDFTAPLLQTGFVLMFLGFAVVGLAGITLGRALTAHPMPNSKGELITTGIYRFVRHPIYSGLLLIGISLTITGGLFPQILFLMALFFLLLYKARFEESLLRERYPNYARYAQSTGRFLPRLKG